MNNVDIEVKKQECLLELRQLEQDCNMLLKCIPALREKALKVKTMKDAEEYNKEADKMFEGLQIIEL